MFGRRKEAKLPEATLIEEKKKEPEAFIPSDVTKIGPGITMVGDFETSDLIELNGTIQGNVLSDKRITISEAGRLEGNGRMESLISSGFVNGTIECRNLTHITSTGKLDGNLMTQTLTTDDGSELIGTLHLKKKPAKANAALPAEASAKALEAPSEGVQN